MQESQRPVSSRSASAPASGGPAPFSRRRYGPIGRGGRRRKWPSPLVRRRCRSVQAVGSQLLRRQAVVCLEMHGSRTVGGLAGALRCVGRSSRMVPGCPWARFAQVVPEALHPLDPRADRPRSVAGDQLLAQDVADAVRPARIHFVRVRDLDVATRIAGAQDGCAQFPANRGGRCGSGNRGHGCRR